MSKSKVSRFTAHVRITAIVEVPLKAANLVAAAEEAEVAAKALRIEEFEVDDYPEEAVVEWIVRE